MNKTARQNERRVYPVSTATPPMVAYTLIESSIFDSEMMPMLKMKRPTNWPRAAPISSPGKKRPAGTAIPYSIAQNTNQRMKNTIAT